MIACRKQIKLAQPLRSVRLAGSRAAECSPDFERQLQARYEQGLREGEQALREQLIRQRAELVELQRGVLKSMAAVLPQVRGECEAALAQLALEVAQRLVASLPISSEMVEGAIREALAAVEDAQEITVLLNEEDYRMLEQANSPALLSTAGGEKVRFAIAPEVTRGGCMVQTRFGLVDARRETKLQRLRQSLQA